ncbi:MAG: GSCFA domain-containing protein [Zavarzinia sp.]|nr:GSCFA domain-containing protein [Zavarzinia sp.]
MPADAVATFGSCFAQHIGNALQDRGFRWMITETPPAGLSPKNMTAFNYNVFSARTGNIYTTSLLRQWVSWATGESTPPDEVWEGKDGIIDPFRPRVEPGGFESVEEMRRSRAVTIDAFRAGLEKARYFVFTLGLTESWVNKSGGYEYPMCPGTVAGTFDETEHEFVNQDFLTVYRNLAASFGMIRRLNKGIRFILTVSPVPLTATNSDEHVLVATMYSKSVLRAVAGQFCQKGSAIDYFPSYEIINSPVFRNAFFEPNQRNVSAYGVNFVMDHFFRCLVAKYGEYAKPGASRGAAVAAKMSKADEVCEEALLEAFGGAK